MFRFDDQTSANQNQFGQVVDKLVYESRELYDSHAWAVGYLGALARHMMSYMGKADQQMFLSWVEAALDEKRKAQALKEAA